jgi:hypothetical protein
MNSVANPNPKALVFGRWRFRLLAFILLASGGFVISQSWTYVKPRSLFQENAKSQDLEIFFKGKSKQQILELISKENIALQGNPLSTEPLKNLTFLNSTIGDAKKSSELTVIVAQRTLQDAGVQIAALSQLLEHKDYAGALERLDALARGEGLTAELATAMSNIASSSDGLNALVQYLVAHPKWRAELITYMASNKNQDVNIVYAMFAAFTKENAPPTLGETQAFLRRLLAEKSYEKAYFIWLDQLSENELLRVSGIFDGNFHFGLGNRFFDWTSEALANAQVSLVPRESGSSEQAVAVDFSSGRTPFANLSQVLKLTSGEYNFSGEHKAERLENERGMVWQIYCLPAMGVAIAKTEAVSGTKPWTAFSTNFKIPEQDCSTQLLRLELNATAVADTQISGRVYFDNLKIERPHEAVDTP